MFVGNSLVLYNYGRTLEHRMENHLKSRLSFRINSILERKNQTVDDDFSLFLLKWILTSMLTKTITEVII